MFPFKRKSNSKISTTSASEDVASDNKEGMTQSRRSWIQKLSGRLSKTRSRLSDGLANLLLGAKEIDESLLESLTDMLIGSDIGVSTSQYIIEQAKSSLRRNEVQNSDMLLAAIKEVMLQMLLPCQKEFILPKEKANSVLFIGVNGAGKTTTIAKMANFLQKQNKQVLLAAGDTFRAAAVEQLQAWGDRHQVTVIAQGAGATGADSAAVIFDAMQACAARKKDVLLADTAGRLHTQNNLLEELAKVKRVMSKVDVSAPQHTLLVLDATSGQNSLVQAKQFHESIGVDGIVLTKLDSSAKGGIIFSICHQLQLPIYFIGVGESPEDLQPFVADTFVAALFATDAVE